MKSVVGCLLCLIVVCELSCSSMTDLMESAIQKPVVKFGELKIDRLSFDAVDLDIKLEVTNPNAIGVNLTGFDYQFLLNEQSFLKGKRNEPINIPASGTKTLPLPLTLNFHEIYSTYNALKSSDSTAYEIKCGVSFDLPVLGEQYIPVSKTGSLPLLKLPTVNIAALQLKKMGFTGAELELAISIDNPNSLAFVLTGINYDLAINGQQWLSGKSKNRQAVSARNESTLRIPFSLNFLQMGQSASQLLSGGNDISYELTGNFGLESNNSLLGNMTLPFDRSGKINIQR